MKDRKHISSIWFPGGISLLLLINLILVTGCQKGLKVYEIEPIHISPNKPRRPFVKNTEQFIAIAFSDLTGQPINQSELNSLKLIYESVGDMKMVEELIIKNLLNRPDIQIPSRPEMLNDIPGFIQLSWLKFYNREPTESERWQLEKMIKEDKNETITPELLWFSLMTSNEYRSF